MQPQSYFRCWVEVDLDALRHNVAAIRRRIGRARLMAVLKADAYGHGLAPVASELMRCGVDAFAVATLGEALTLRQLGGTGWPILLFGSALPFEVEKIVEQDITPTISTLEEAQMFEAAAAARQRRIPVHIEIDTGMGRVGFWHEQAASAIRQIAALPHLRIEALYTHFPSADEDLEETRRQLELFLRCSREASLGAAGADSPSPLLRHAANSAALLNLPESHLDMVRPGLLLYGIVPSAAAASTIQPFNEFRPVLAFKARVAHVKEVAAGRTISYGQTFRADRPMSIATVAAGYADGFSRHLSNKAEVLIGGRRCRVVGRVTMDQLMVDVTGLAGVRCGEEVVLIGRQGAAEITAGEVAGWEETIPWEVLCGITKSARVPRIYRGAAAA
jgi:alanine racemase